MKLSKLETKSNAVLDLLDIDWEDLVESFEEHSTEFENKFDVPLISPCEFREGATRSNANALRVHFGVIDIDNINKEEYERLLNKMELYSYLVYTSWSHTKQGEIEDCYKLRFVFPFSRPVEASEWSKFWPKLNLFFNGHIDPQCKDIQRGYFVPACKNIEEHWTKVNHGMVFNVDSLQGQNIQELKSDKITWNDLKELANKLKDSKSSYFKKQGEALLAASAGEAIADHGDRDNSLFSVANVIASEFDKFDSRQVAILFNKSLEKMRQNGSQKATMENFIAKLNRAKEKIKEEKEAKRQEKLSELSNNIKRAFRTGRTEAYTTEELNNFAQELGVSLQDFQKLWILYKDKQNYIFVDGRYRGPVTNNDMLPHVHVELSPALTANVSTKKEVKDKKVDKSLTELREEYGTHIEGFETDLTAAHSSFDVKTNTFIEAPCPIRVFEAKEDPQIDKYIELLGGKDSEKLKDFISVVTRLEDPCAALYLYGAKGVGKSLFAQGLSRLWTTEGATDITGVLTENFNSSLLKCPLILADETMPKSFRQDGKTGEFRRFLQERSRELKRKYRDPSTLRGCVRVIIAANNTDLLDTTENLDQHDIEAIAERVLFIECGEAAATYLASIPDIKTWISEDRIAKHALWLAETRKVESNSRFLVTGSSGHLHQQMMVKNGLASAILNWLVSYLQAPNLIDNQQSGLIRIKDGELLVNQKILLDRWDMYVTNTKPPTASTLTKAMKRISEGTKLIKWNKPVRYKIIKTQSLIEWAEISDMSTKEEILEALSKDTQKSGVRVLKDILEVN